MESEIFRRIRRMDNENLNFIFPENKKQRTSTEGLRSFVNNSYTPRILLSKKNISMILKKNIKHLNTPLDNILRYKSSRKDYSESRNEFNNFNIESFPNSNIKIQTPLNQRILEKQQFHKNELNKLKSQIIELNAEISDLKKENNLLNNAIQMLTEFILPNQWNEIERKLSENKAQEYFKILHNFNAKNILLKSKNVETMNNSNLENENRILKNSNLTLRKLIYQTNNKFKNYKVNKFQKSVSNSMRKHLQKEEIVENSIFDKKISDPFNNLIYKILRINFFPNLLFSIISGLKEIIDFDKGSFYIFDKHLKKMFLENSEEGNTSESRSCKLSFSGLFKNNFHKSKFSNFIGYQTEGLIEKKEYVGFSHSFQTYSSLNCKNIYELSSGIRNVYYLGGVCRQKGNENFLIGFQIERTKSKSLTDFIHFNENDEKVFQKIIEFLTLKLLNFKLQFQQEMQFRKTSSLLNLISELLVERTYPGIFSSLRRNTYQVTGYSDSCVIFYNFVEKELFLMGDYLNSGNIITLKFPISGLSGLAITTKEIYINKTGEKGKYFEEEIDNLLSITKIHNYAFVPLIDYKDRVLGVLQLYNKKSTISNREVEKLFPISKLIGMCILNANEMNSSISLACNIQEEVKSIKQKMKIGDQINRSSLF